MISLFESVQLSRTIPPSNPSTFHLRLTHSFTQALSTYTLHMSEPLQHISIHFFTQLGFHTHLVPHFLIPSSSILVTTHILREHFISITDSLCFSPIPFLRASDPYVTVGTTTLSNNSLVTPETPLLTSNLIFNEPKLFSRSHTFIFTYFCKLPS